MCRALPFAKYRLRLTLSAALGGGQKRSDTTLQTVGRRRKPGRGHNHEARDQVSCVHHPIAGSVLLTPQSPTFHADGRSYRPRMTGRPPHSVSHAGPREIQAPEGWGGAKWPNLGSCSPPRGTGVCGRGQVIAQGATLSVLHLACLLCPWYLHKNVVTPGWQSQFLYCPREILQLPSGGSLPPTAPPLCLTQLQLIFSHKPYWGQVQGALRVQGEHEVWARRKLPQLSSQCKINEIVK